MPAAFGSSGSASALACSDSGAALAVMTLGSAPPLTIAPTTVRPMRTAAPIRTADTHSRRVPEDLERLVLWLLRKDPGERPASAAVVYDRLLSFCRDLPSFPGYVDAATPDPVRMYANVVGRIRAG
ncbi:hypothetical protein [Herbidospora mongoliensis]|uniref:hypothetical protein n=1 Tax=Herbidospora mongoliensis TaxID=688067 RepID=UPI000AAE604A|nr:hypothetical protein [Herbidospora mongoliensis]